MMKISRDLILGGVCLVAIAAGSTPRVAHPDPGRSDQAMQDKLNADILNRGFDPGDPGAIEADLDDAVRKGVKPPLDPPRFWRPGYTCGDILGYGYGYYRNCRLYHRYYGCYYCRW